MVPPVAGRARGGVRWDWSMVCPLRDRGVEDKPRATMPLTAIETFRQYLAHLSDDPEAGLLARQLSSVYEQALTEAEQAGRRRLIHDLAHQLGGPLSEVLGYAELPIDGQVAHGEWRVMLERIIDASTRAMAILHTITARADGS